MLKQEIKQRKDISKLVHSFYAKAIHDQTIGMFFTNVINLDMEQHLPTIIDFWESVLLGTGSYKGNPIKKHLRISEINPLQAKHFKQWIALWNETVDELFTGEKAEEAKKKATLMSELMQYKIAQSTDPNFIQ